MRFSQKKLALIISLLFLSACAGGQKKNQMDKDVKKDMIKSEDSAKPKAKEKAETKAESEYTCKVEGDERKIAVVKDGQGCKVLYTKMGEEKEAASSASGSDFCIEKAQQIVNNLESATFSCNK